MKACMGGFCRIRSKCPNYTEADRFADAEPVERLCWRGHDGAGPLCEIDSDHARAPTFTAPNHAEVA